MWWNNFEIILTEMFYETRNSKFWWDILSQMLYSIKVKSAKFILLNFKCIPRRIYWSLTIFFFHLWNLITWFSHLTFINLNALFLIFLKINAHKCLWKENVFLWIIEMGSKSLNLFWKTFDTKKLMKQLTSKLFLMSHFGHRNIDSFATIIFAIKRLSKKNIMNFLPMIFFLL